MLKKTYVDNWYVIVDCEFLFEIGIKNVFLSLSRYDSPLLISAVFFIVFLCLFYVFGLYRAKGPTIKIKNYTFVKKNLSCPTSMARWANLIEQDGLIHVYHTCYKLVLCSKMDSHNHMRYNRQFFFVPHGVHQHSMILLNGTLLPVKMMLSVLSNTDCEGWFGMLNPSQATILKMDSLQ